MLVRSNILDQLWAASVTKLEIDLASQSCVLYATAVDAGITSYYVLRFQDVAEFRFYNSAPAVWDYVELTEIHAAPDSSGAAVDIVLWAEEAGIHVSAGAVTVNGQSIFPMEE